MAWFPDRNDSELERLAGLVFDLRRRIFYREEYHHAHEREWESEDQEQRRERRNERALQEWDNETLRMIQGDVTAKEGP